MTDDARNGPPASIRRALPDDAEVLARFNVAAARETEDEVLDPVRALSGVRAVFERPERGFYVVAEEAGEVVASLLITPEWSDWRNALFWWIQSVYVEPAARRRGLFRRLYAWVQAEAAKDPTVCGLRLYVIETNEPALRTYDAVGMRQTAYRLWESKARG